MNRNHKINSRIHAKNRFEQRVDMKLNKQLHRDYFNWVKNYNSPIKEQGHTKNSIKKLAPIKENFYWVIYDKKHNVIKTIFRPKQNITQTKVFNKNYAIFLALITFKFKIIKLLLKYEVPYKNIIELKGKTLIEPNYLNDSNQKISPLSIQYLMFLSNIKHPEFKSFKFKMNKKQSINKKNTALLYKFLKNNNLIKDYNIE